jgi:thiamine pyrophosphokinase
MATLLEHVAETRKARDDAELAFREALARARRHYSLMRVADAAGLTKNGVKYLVEGRGEK